MSYLFIQYIVVHYIEINKQRNRGQEIPEGPGFRWIFGESFEKE